MIVLKVLLKNIVASFIATPSPPSLTKLPANPIDVVKRQKTMIERYGSVMPMNDHPDLMKKKEATSMKKYGVKNAAHAPVTREKARTTMLNRSTEAKEKSWIQF